MNAQLSLCGESGCDKPIRTKGLCASHYARKWNIENRERHNANWRSYYANNADSRRDRERARTIAKYGITRADYEAMLAKQCGVCAICQREERCRLKIGGVLRSLAIDHDHDTGKVRGLLCASCNRGIARFGDDPIALRRAAEYLERSI